MSYPHHKFQLKNKISGITVRIPCAKTTTLIIACQVGSKDEKKNQTGVAHLLEHMLFRGSSHINSVTELTKKMDQLGSVFNAYVSKHVTYYHCKFYWNEDNFPQIVQLLTNIVTEPLLRAKDLELEKEIVLNEIDEYLNDEEEHLDELLTSTIFGDHPLAHAITGDRNIIEKCTIKTLKEFYHKYYLTNNISAVLVGKYSDQAAETFQDLLSQIKPRIGSLPKPLNPLPINSKWTFQVQTRRDNNQIVLGIAFPTIGFEDPQKNNMIILNDLVAGSNGSRLNQVLRERKGLIYSISSNYFRYPEGGIMIIKTSFSPDKLKEVLKLIYHEIEHLKKGIRKDQFKQHLESLIRETWLEGENIFTLAEHYAQELIFFKNRPLRHYHHQIKSFKKINPEEVSELASKILDWKKASLIAIGPLQEKDLEKALPESLSSL